jgi:hypothetical protein
VYIVVYLVVNIVVKPLKMKKTTNPLRIKKERFFIPLNIMLTGRRIMFRAAPSCCFRAAGRSTQSQQFTRAPVIGCPSLTPLFEGCGTQTFAALILLMCLDLRFSLNARPTNRGVRLLRLLTGAQIAPSFVWGQNRSFAFWGRQISLCVKPWGLPSSFAAERHNWIGALNSRLGTAINLVCLGTNALQKAKIPLGELLSFKKGCGSVFVFGGFVLESNKPLFNSLIIWRFS